MTAADLSELQALVACGVLIALGVCAISETGSKYRSGIAIHFAL